jgi:hypothetical protein
MPMLSATSPKPFSSPDVGYVCVWASCTSRGIVCVPQARGPGRPPGSRARAAAAAMSAGSYGGTRMNGDRSLCDDASSVDSHMTTFSEPATRGSLFMAPRDPMLVRLFMEASHFCKGVLLQALRDEELDIKRTLLLR